MKTRRRASLVLPLALLAAAACGDDISIEDSGVGDADAADSGADTSDTGMLSILIEAPALPVLTPCPAGWREVPGDVRSPAYCEPYAEGGIADCPVTEAHYPGTAGCAPVGDPCPADGWPVDLPSTGVIYVRADAAAGGDGTRASPLSSVGDAVDMATDGAVLALAPGAYGAVRVERPLSIVGACTDVVLTTPATEPIVYVRGAELTLRNVRVSDGPEGIQVNQGGLIADNVVIDQIRGTGLQVTRSMVTASRLRFITIQDAAMALQPGSSLRVSQLSVHEVGNDAIRTTGGDVVVADGVIVRDTYGPFYFGSQSGGVSFERMALLGLGTILGLNAPRIELRDTVLIGPPFTGPTPPGAIAGFEGADVVFERVRIELARSLGVAVADPGGVLEATDVIFRDIVGADDGVGHALEVAAGAEAFVERVHIERARANAILAAGRDTQISVSDLSIADTLPNEFGTFGRGLQVQNGATLTGSRVAVRGSHEAAIVSGVTGANISLQEVLVEGTLARTCTECPSAGVGVGAYEGGAVTLDRFLITGSALAGLQLANNGQIDLSVGEVADNPVGVNIQVPDYDIDRLTADVAFRNNGTNLDSAELPVPDPSVTP